MTSQRGIAFIPILIWGLLILAGIGVGSEITNQHISLSSSPINDVQPSAQKVDVTPSPLPNENLTPNLSSSPIPAPQKVQPVYVDPDPITSCNNPNCGSISIPKSKCSNTDGYVCCQVGNTWTWYSSRTQCSKDQQGSTISDADPVITCNSKTGKISIKRSICNSYTDCPDGRGGYIFESQDSCKQRWNRIGQDLTKYTKEYWDAKLEQDRLKTQLGIQEMQNTTNQAIQDMDNIVNSVSQPTFKAEPLPTIKNIPPPPPYVVKCSDLRGEGYIIGLHCDPG